MDIRKFLNRFRQNTKTPHCTAVVLAAGASSRMGTDKTMIELAGVPVVIRSLMAFEKHDLVDEIILVTREEMLQELADLCHGYAFHKLRAVVKGGASRVESSLAGVSAVSSEAEYIAIHDAARPLVTEQVITDALYGARDYHAAVPVIPSVDTLREVSEGFISGDVDRDSVIRIQTPQIFDADLIKGALTYCVSKGLPVTDDSSAIRHMGIKTRAVNGDQNNIKLTTPEDILIAEAVLRQRGEKS